MRHNNKQINQDSASINIKDKYPTQNNLNVEDITIVIPTLNEEEAISSVIEDVITHGYENIIIVDGNSTDRTVEIAKKHGVKILKQNGKGKTGAIITAIQNIKTPSQHYKKQNNKELSKDKGFITVNNIFGNNIKIPYTKLEFIYFEYITAIIQLKSSTSFSSRIGYKILKKFKLFGRKNNFLPSTHNFPGHTIKLKLG